MALLNPLRTHRFAGEDLERTKTDAIDALGHRPLRRREAPGRPPGCPTRPPRSCANWSATATGWLQDFDDRVRQLHRLVDLGFPEFTRYVRTLDSKLASAILHDYPTAAAFRRRVGQAPGQACATTAATSVGPELAAR